MRKQTRAVLAAAPLSLALLLAACGSDDDSADTTTTTTTSEASASSSSETTETTAGGETTTPPSSEATTSSSAPETTTPPSDATEPATTAPPEDGTEGEFGRSAAAQLVRAWGAGDRDRALELATPRAVGMFDPGGPDWELTGCDGAAGTIYCTFDSVSKAMTLQVAQPNVPDESGELPLIDRVEFLP